VEQQETPALIAEMHNALRDVFARAYRETPDQVIRDLMSRAYMYVEKGQVAISAIKGFPYITYPTNVTTPLTKRVMTKLGRWYTGTVDPNANAPNLGRMIDALHATAVARGYVLDKDLCVELLAGKDLYDAYQAEVGAHSCMSAGNTPRTWLYVLNPDVIQLAVTSNKKARALLWTTETGHKILDRIYPGTGFSSNFLKNWALGMGYYTRDNNAASGGQSVVGKAPFDVETAVVKLDKLHPRHIFPYLDTFRYVQVPYETSMRMAMRQLDSSWKHHDQISTLPVERVGGPYGTIADWETVLRAPLADYVAGSEQVR